MRPAKPFIFNSLLFSYAGLNEFTVIFSAGILAAASTFFLNWLSLIPWRRSRNRHWTEQARLVYPAMTAAQSNFFNIPAIMALVVTLSWPESSPLWFFTGVTALLGANVGMTPSIRELFPHVLIRGWLKRRIIGFLLEAPIWFVLFGAAVWMPDVFNTQALLIGALTICLCLLWQQGSLFRLAIKADLYSKAPERLQRIAATTSARMQIPFCEVILIKSQIAQARAFLHNRRLGFSDRLLEILTDEEIAAICAHELAHLTESQKNYRTRQALILGILPWIYINPLIHTCSLVFPFLILLTIAIARFGYSTSQKLEARADEMAKIDAVDGGIYARALSKMYQDTLVPAVIAGQNKSHPDLYDRILAAGAIPDYPRPIPAKSTLFHAKIFRLIFWFLFGQLIMRILKPHLGG